MQRGAGGGGGGGSTPINTSNGSFAGSSFFRPPSSGRDRSRPGTSSGPGDTSNYFSSSFAAQQSSQALQAVQFQQQLFQQGIQPTPTPPPSSQTQQPNVLTKERKGSVGRKTSFSSPGKGKRRANSSSSSGGGPGGGGGASNGANNGSGSGTGALGGGAFTDSSRPPALPDFALAAAAKISRETDVIQSPASADSFPNNNSSGNISSSTGGGAGGGGGGGGGGGRMNGRTGSSSASQRPNLYGGTTGSGPGQLPTAMNPSYLSIQQPQQESSVVHMQVAEMAAKRISTLDYLRKAHEGRVYWFNTVLFEKPDLQRMPSFANPTRLARRATNYLLLGLSLPAVIDLNSGTPLEFLRGLYTLLQEFEAFQQLHGDGSAGGSGSLTRARLPQVFRRTAFGKSRRSTGGAGGSLPNGTINGGGSAGASDYGPNGTGDGGLGGLSGGAANASVMSFAASETDLLPGEEYTHLLTPSLPFEPDYFETFATLCDVLIDTYTRLMGLLPTPRDCTAPVAELFAKCDAKIRKIVVQGVVRDFEEQSRVLARAELGAIGRAVLAPLM